MTDTLYGETASNIDCIQFLDEEIEMCDITIDSEEHSYYANGVATHNCAQESKILALLSQDSLMISNFLADLDPHTATAYGIWGKEDYDKAKRKIAKGVNFCTAYGGGPSTLSDTAEIPLDEAKALLKKYEDAFWQSMEWKKKQVNKMYFNGGDIFNIFGRPRRLGSFLRVANRNEELAMDTPEYYDTKRKCSGFIMAAERRVASHEIQGMAGDLCRYVLIKLYNKYFKHEDRDIDFINVVHDEINFYINNDKESILKYARELQDLMEFQPEGFQFPINTSLDLGHRWGSCFNFEWVDKKTREELIPKRCH